MPVGAFLYNYLFFILFSLLFISAVPKRCGFFAMKGNERMNEKYKVEINPIDKEEELLEIFREYKPTSYSITDEGYDWLENDQSKCIVIKNPYCENDVEIELENMDQITLFFADFHTHYFAYQGYYDDMVRTVKSILMNETCSGVIKNLNGKWFGSTLAEKSEIGKDPQVVFDFIFNIDEFRRNLSENGYKINYCFWDPVDDSVIVHDKH